MSAVVNVNKEDKNSRTLNGASQAKSNNSNAAEEQKHHPAIMKMKIDLKNADKLDQ